MENPCFGLKHRLIFYNCLFKSGMVAHFYYCQDCKAQSNWVQWKKIPECYQKTVESWETRGHLEGVPYLGREPHNRSHPPGPRLTLAHEKSEVPMPEPKPRAEAPVFNPPKAKIPTSDHGHGNPETELERLKRTIHNLTLQRDSVIVENDKLKCELVALKKFKSQVLKQSRP